MALRCMHPGGAATYMHARARARSKPATTSSNARVQLYITIAVLYHCPLYRGIVTYNTHVVLHSMHAHAAPHI
eukprot:COSAG05_NODE_60_length_23142_cov_25.372130_14_plen_73_part_00